MTKQNSKLTLIGLKCDNPDCDYIDNTVDLDTLAKAKIWIDAKCPKCGSILLTQEDYYALEGLNFVVGEINKFPINSENDERYLLYLETDGSGQINIVNPEITKTQIKG